MSISLQFKSGSSASLPKGSDKPQVFARAMVGTPIQEGPRTAEGRPPASTADIQAATARVRATEQKPDSDVSLQVTAPRLKPSGFGLLVPGAVAATAAVKLAAPALLAGPAFPVVAAAAGVMIGGVALLNVINSGRFASVSNEKNLEDGKIGVRSDLFPDAGVDEIQAGPSPRLRDGDLADPNAAATRPEPEINLEQPKGPRLPVDLEMPVVMSPPDNRPESELPTPLTNGKQRGDSNDAFGAIEHVFGVPNTNSSKISRLTGKGDISDAEKRDVLTQIYSLDWTLRERRGVNTQIVDKLTAQATKSLIRNIGDSGIAQVHPDGRSWSKMTDVDLAVIKAYTADSSALINGAMREEFDGRFEPHEFWKLPNPEMSKTGEGARIQLYLKAGKIFEEALEKAPRYEGFAYRGVEFSESQLDKFQPGALISFPSVSSASKKNESFFLDEYPVELRIYGVAADLSAVNSDEDEVVFSKGLYRVMGREERDGKTVINLHQVR